jgi:hypothetical protein
MSIRTGKRWLPEERKAWKDQKRPQSQKHSRMARGGHGLPKVSPGPAMPNPSTPCERETPETALRLFQGCPTHRVCGLRPSSTFLDAPRRTPMVRGAMKNVPEIELPRRTVRLSRLLATASFFPLIYKLIRKNLRWNLLWNRQCINP